MSGECVFHVSWSQYHHAVAGGSVVLRSNLNNGFKTSRQPLQHAFFSGAARAAHDVNEVLLE